MDEKKIQKMLAEHMVYSRGAVCCAPNVFFFHHKQESDFLVVTTDDEVIECEVKVSKWDFLNDFKKTDKHTALRTKADKSRIPNFFYYVAPEGLIDRDDIPEYAGLYEVIPTASQMGKVMKMIKRAPRLHSLKLEPESWKRIAVKLFNKMY